tara:strand:+ start:540 stop:968 length:429 start_codon:yes stop_codon:yes gene_type:complete
VSEEFNFISTSQKSQQQSFLSKSSCRKKIKYHTQKEAWLRRWRMHDVIIVYWRDIPAQVIVGKGRRATKIQLSERFEQAIDRAAMKSNQRSTDDYLAEWRKAKPFKVEGNPENIAKEQAEKLEAEYDKEKLILLVNNNGRAT